MSTTFSTPGVYINEINGFPNSVVPAATAVPAFIGYTPRAQYQGKSYYNMAFKITSFAEFQAIYMLPGLPAPADPPKQYSPEYYLVKQDSQPEVGEYMMIGGNCYSILPDPDTVYYLYNSVRLFYQNGGGEAYIVAIGGYGAPSKKSMAKPDDPILNSNVKLADLQRGLALLKAENEPTMYICPEATLLPAADNGTLVQSMLLQAEAMQTTVCLFDIIGGHAPDPIGYTKQISAFREGSGLGGLKYGVAYYPFIGTTIMQGSDIDFTNLFGGDIGQLTPYLNPPDAPNPVAAQILDSIKTPPATPLSNGQLQAALLVASPLYVNIINHVLSCANMMPPSGAIAGVYANNDRMYGVWNSPANCSIVGAANLPIKITDAQQENMNIDAVSGKSINAIRFFKGLGIMIWGARTLDGNSQDWRYVSVRRTMTFLEQSIKMAMRAHVFNPNNASTWTAIASEINSFLTDVWKQGGLQGAAPAAAFTVMVGLGTTMTPDDLLNGYLRVSVKVCVVRPAEFIVLTFQQQQATSG